MNVSPQCDFMLQWSEDWPSSPHPNAWVECHDHPTAWTWYDELIVSRKPIAPPA